jgi:hypothetical protein
MDRQSGAHPPIFISSRISSRVAPASSAARIWRRAPAALRLVQATWMAMQINSISLTDRMPLVHGLLAIWRYFPTQSASHARSVSRAESSCAVSRCRSTFGVLSVSLFSSVLSLLVKLGCSFRDWSDWQQIVGLLIQDHQPEMVRPYSTATSTSQPSTLTSSFFTLKPPPGMTSVMTSNRQPCSGHFTTHPFRVPLPRRPA